MLVGYDLTNENYHGALRRDRSYRSKRVVLRAEYEGPSEVDSKELHLRALGNAVAFAVGTRYEDEHYLASGRTWGRCLHALDRGARARGSCS